MKSLFPHENVRPIQKDMLSLVSKAIEKKKHVIMHAPTGIGKTAATIAPALEYALENDKTVFFLTSRHTQHEIVLDTLKQIQDKCGEKVIVADIIGKRWLCPQFGGAKISSGDFIEFCKSQREKDLCSYYTNTTSKNKLTVEGQAALDKVRESIHGAEGVIKICENYKVCPYEVLMKLANSADVVIADYYYIFNPVIQENFFSRSSGRLEDSIIIVDEGHNLPVRIRELLSTKLSSFIISRAIKEAGKYSNDGISEYITKVEMVLKNMSRDVKYEKLVSTGDFVNLIKRDYDYEQMAAALEFAADDVREQQRSSFIGSISSFMSEWPSEDEGFIRIIESRMIKGEQNITLSRRCLDPAIISADIIKKSHTTILMSGTLSPMSMYKDVLGFPDGTFMESFDSPFPKKNRMTMVIPKTTTKYSARNEKQYQEIATIVSDISNSVPGNSAVFFPSYRLLTDIAHYYNTLSKKTTFTEAMGMDKNEKKQMLEQFKKYKDSGAVLLGVASANFAEGIDLPGDFLKCVVIVGLPLQPPNLETKELIRYYDNRFSNGWDYGYVLPAITKSMQAAGRCIRTETDKGMIIFLDQRYTWPNYFKCFPSDWDIKITVDFQKEISKFYGTQMTLK
ncbi:ATP-dependent DNA helicase [Candidatus Woesearchaeota archaeon]|nr:ATP-dependent DNA helicase [Candidatus Woesearchaeota archaeon]